MDGEEAGGTSSALLRNKPRRRRRQRRDFGPAENEAAARKVYVSGYSNIVQPQDILSALVPHGASKLERITNKFAILSFASEGEAQAVLKKNNNISVNGERLTMNAYLNKFGPPGNKRTFERSKKKSEIIQPQFINLKGTFYEQLDNVVFTIRLTSEQVKNTAQLYVDLETALQTQWPGCQALAFGSIAIGLGIKTSDADCFIQIPEELSSGNTNYVHKVRRILQTMPHIFCEVISIPRANTPIVKFFHIPTEMNGDVSFKNPIGTENSKLVAFLLYADPRLVPIAILIKYWAKVHGFSGTGKLTSYALIMMLFFYLQQLPVPILPSVESLQNDESTQKIIDNWNAGFLINYEELPSKAMNLTTIPDLLGEFFQYYASFNFEEMVVCPYIGYPIKKTAFQEPELLPAEFARYKNNVQNKLTSSIRYNTPICVQDPIEQCHNVASAITPRLASEIILFFKFAAKTYDTEKNNEYKDFLRTILLSKPQISSKKIKDCRVDLTASMLTIIDNPDWKLILKVVTSNIFEKLLKINMEKVDATNSQETKNEKEKYMCTATKPFWKHLPELTKDNNISMSFAAEQMKMVEHVIKSDENICELQFLLIITFNIRLRKASLVVKNMHSDADNFKDFCKWFVTAVQLWYKALLKDYINPGETSGLKSVDYMGKNIGHDNEDMYDYDSDNNSTDNLPELSDLENNDEGACALVLSSDSDTD